MLICKYYVLVVEDPVITTTHADKDSLTHGSYDECEVGEIFVVDMLQEQILSREQGTAVCEVRMGMMYDVIEHFISMEPPSLFVGSEPYFPVSSGRKLLRGQQLVLRLGCEDPSTMVTVFRRLGQKHLCRTPSWWVQTYRSKAFQYFLTIEPQIFETKQDVLRSRRPIQLAG